MGDQDHKDAAERNSGPVRVALLVVSDTKTADTDVSGKLAFEILAKYGHEVVLHEILRNDRKAVTEGIAKAIKGGANVVLTIGGTGISKKDLSADAVLGYAGRELPGFGELFRRASEKEIGTAALMSRACLVATDDGCLVAALPGSPGGVRLAVEEILLPELRHLLWELRRYG